MNRHERRAQAKAGGVDPRLQQGLAAFQEGRLDEAQAVMATVLAKSPRDPVALHIAGLIAFQKGDPDKAIVQLAAAVKAKPDYAEAQNNLGRLLLILDRPAEAAERFRAALRHVRDVAEIHAHLGEALLAERQLGAASGSFRRALALDPRQLSALSGIGTLATALGRGSDACRWHGAALALSSDFSPSRRGLGEARLVSGDATGAISGFEAALKAMPQDLALLGNLAVAWREAGQLDRGLAYQRRILALQPATAEALGHLSQGLFVLGRATSALTLARRRLATESSESARKSVRATMLYVPSLDPAVASALRRRLAPASAAAPRFKNTPDPAQTLRVAYLSSDMRDHPVARSLLPLIGGHDRAAVEPHLYGEVAREDAVTERFKALGPWRSTIGLDDDRLAVALRKDGIDIAVFVGGSFDTNRLEAAARRCAPLQISLHDGGTSGIAAIDALIADSWLVPRREQERFSERVLRLPDLYLHQPIADSPDPALPDGPPVFAAAANPAKLNRETLALWARVLEAVPEARLRLRYRAAFDDTSLKAEIAAALPAGRVEFAPGEATASAHLAFYREAHVVLDTWPFSGSTSSFEALWMGVPVVTLAGGSMAERWCGALLQAIRRQEWIAADGDAYVVTAAALARDRDRLAKERASLRAALAPLTDGKRRAMQIERLYRALWRRWCESVA
ncbi:MAG: tetratricopeptide repeat protein [Alphaproteobacteria bacterium]|nr:tetratricopeptide repeat protein [Alphaproteobacteria bacterium]